MAGSLGRNFQKGPLRSAVAVEKGMDRVQLVEVLGRARREPIRGEAAQIMFGVDGAETLAHLRLDEFGSAEGGGAASGRDPTILPCPILEVLKEVSVNGAAAGWRDRRIVAKRQQPVSGKVAFQVLQLFRVADVELVPVDVRAGIAVGMRLHTAASAFARRFAR
jgi:hypothetical protein